MIKKEYMMMCDSCAQWEHAKTAWNKRSAIAEARRFGWTMGKKLKCPECNGRDKGYWRR